MKKAIRVILFIIGLLLIIGFWVSVGYDYYLMKTRMFANPLGIQFTVILSGILFFVPGIIFLIAAYIMKRKEIK